MTQVSYNQFRSLHKGTPQKKVSKLWKKYKDGKYKLPAEEGKDFVTVNEGELYIPPPEKPTKAVTPIEVEIEEEVTPLEEKSDLEVIGDLCKEYTQLQRKMELLGPRLDDEAKAAGHARLKEIALSTIPKGYSCTPTDSWKIWFGPTSKSLLINTTNQMAFQITREWWQKNYQNTIYVDRELLNNNDLIDIEIRRYFRMGRFLPRSPVVGTECQLPQGVKDIQIRGGQGTN